MTAPAAAKGLADITTKNTFPRIPSTFLTVDVEKAILGDKHRMTHPVGFRANRMISDFTGFHPVPGKLQDDFVCHIVFDIYFFIFVNHPQMMSK